MRTAFLLLFVSGLSYAESHPTWWTYASPEATALVGIRWDALRLSPFAPAIASEFADGGSLRFPDLACLKDAEQVIISSPALLAMVTGNFPAALVREQAAAALMKPSSYRGIPLWIHPSKDTLSVAVIADQLLLVASRRALEAAIDRTDPNSAEGARPANRRYSPLLARAARYSQSSDLWVIATRLPDPLASLFVPFDVEAKGLEGSLSLRDGLHVEAVLDSGSEDRAAATAGDFRQSIPTLPAIARGLQVATAKASVVLALDVSREQLAVAWRDSSAPPEPIRVAAVEPIRIAAAEPAKVAAVEPAKVAALEPAKIAAVEPPKPEAPQVIRIIGLDDGPREILLPPVKKQRY